MDVFDEVLQCKLELIRVKLAPPAGQKWQLLLSFDTNSTEDWTPFCPSVVYSRLFVRLQQEANHQGLHHHYDDNQADDPPQHWHDEHCQGVVNLPHCKEEKVVKSRTCFLRTRCVPGVYIWHVLWSTTIRVKVALWLRFFSLGFLAKQVYSPWSSKVMFHSRMEMLLVFEEPTNSTRSWYTVVLGSTPSMGMSPPHNCTKAHVNQVLHTFSRGWRWCDASCFQHLYFTIYEYT